MVGFGGSRSWDDVAPGDVRLIPLLHHSDCDGELTPAECRQITEALSSLLDRMPDPESWLHDATRAFAAGCRLAADLDEPLDFH
jgi:hypothetical protein